MISAGVDGRLPYMTYPEPWRGPPKQPPVEFVRPAPKPLPNNINNNNNRYNGMISTNPNGTRLAPPPQRPISKYPNQGIIITPVNLTQHKEEPTTTIVDDLQFNAYARLFPHNAHFSPFPPYPPSALYSTHYAHMMRQASFPQTPLSPLETFSPTTPTATNNNSSTFLSPSYSPPSSIHKQNQIAATLRENKRTPPHSVPNVQPPPSSPTISGGFKVPSGKEGSLKHRILTLRPEDLAAARNNNNNPLIGPLDLQLQKTIETPRKRLLATLSPPPRSPKKTVLNSSLNNSILPVNFNAGSLIQLANGDLRRIEDMRTEDFINSAENNPELRLAESTVVRIDDNKNTGNATITLSYNQRRTQVEVESSIEHPFFIYGQGWASCNPEKTLENYKLKVNKLQVGDILVSLTPREPSSFTLNNRITSTTTANTILTSSTTTSMISRQITTPTSMGDGRSNSINSGNCTNNDQMQPLNLHSSNNGNNNNLSPDNRKRRWSAPDQICENDNRRHRGE